ncbi:hypothetical protein [uncultured Tenacibaculum sp.]|uniref:hypothetical protein n=1 Tax=uncultured Tenacibaculum sp. TaxID=174713 RepID=UPI0026228807|nr:hypothetical protein [uncultured Tenacibaculum sp.]
MKKIVMVLFLIPIMVYSQKIEVKNSKYRRSSLHTFLLETNEFPEGEKEVVINAYKSAPFPAKYNDHTIKEGIINPSQYWIDENEIPEGLSSNEQKRVLEKNINKVNTELIIDKYFKDKKIANQLIAKWFNRSEEGLFDMSLVEERGFYDASKTDIANAEKTTRGVNSVLDNSEELIKNTFVIVNKLKYVSNEVAAKAVHLTATKAASELKNIIAQKIAQKAADVIYNKTRKGYSVWTTSYLYQLDWNKENSTKFYQDFWMDVNTGTLEDKKEFDTLNLFSLNLIGSQSSSNIILFTGGKTTDTKEKVITKATIRNVEKVFAKLQKEYDVFKTKSPIQFDEDEIYVEIGLKEGVDKNTKFEALEAYYDEVTGETTYKRIATLKVNKNKIWDNQFGATDDPKNKAALLKGTYLKGCKNCYEGILIRQIK